MKSSPVKVKPIANLKNQYEASLKYIKKNSRAVLADLGIEAKKINSLKDLPTQVRNFTQKNPTPLRFVKNVDCAFYELREEFKWKSTMLVALCKQTIAHQEQAVKNNLFEHQSRYKNLVLARFKGLRKKSQSSDDALEI